MPVPRAALWRRRARGCPRPPAVGRPTSCVRRVTRHHRQTATAGSAGPRRQTDLAGLVSRWRVPPPPVLLPPLPLALPPAAPAPPPPAAAAAAAAGALPPAAAHGRSQGDPACAAAAVAGGIIAPPWPGHPYGIAPPPASWLAGWNPACCWPGKAATPASGDPTACAACGAAAGRPRVGRRMRSGCPAAAAAGRIGGGAGPGLSWLAGWKPAGCCCCCCCCWGGCCRGCCGAGCCVRGRCGGGCAACSSSSLDSRSITSGSAGLRFCSQPMACEGSRARAGGAWILLSTKQRPLVPRINMSGICATAGGARPPAGGAPGPSMQPAAA